MGCGKSKPKESTYVADVAPAIGESVAVGGDYGAQTQDQLIGNGSGPSTYFPHHRTWEDVQTLSIKQLKQHLEQLGVTDLPPHTCEKEQLQAYIMECQRSVCEQALAQFQQSSYVLGQGASGYAYGYDDGQGGYDPNQSYYYDSNAQDPNQQGRRYSAEERLMKMKRPLDYTKESFQNLSVADIKHWLAHFGLKPKPTMLEKYQIVDYLFEQVAFDKIQDLWITLGSFEQNLQHRQEQERKLFELHRKQNEAAQNEVALTPEEQMLVAALLVVIRKIKSQAIAWKTLIGQDLEAKVPRYGKWQPKDKVFYKGKPVVIQTIDSYSCVVLVQDTKDEIETSPEKLRRFDRRYFPEQAKYAELEELRDQLMTIVHVADREEQAMAQANFNERDDGEPSMEEMGVLLEEIAQFLINGHFARDEREQLPPDWVEKISGAHGQAYYFNQKTGETTWQKPEWPKEDEHEKPPEPPETIISPKSKKTKEEIAKRNKNIEKALALFDALPDSDEDGIQRSSQKLEGPIMLPGAPANLNESKILFENIFLGSAIEDPMANSFRYSAEDDRNKWAEGNLFHCGLNEKPDQYMRILHNTLHGINTPENEDADFVEEIMEVPSATPGAEAVYDEQTQTTRYIKKRKIPKIHLKAANQRRIFAENIEEFLNILQDDTQNNDDLVFPIFDLRANGFAPSKGALKKTAKKLGTGKKLKGKKLVPTLIDADEEEENWGSDQLAVSQAIEAANDFSELLIDDDDAMDSLGDISFEKGSKQEAANTVVKLWVKSLKEYKANIVAEYTAERELCASMGIAKRDCGSTASAAAMGSAAIKKLSACFFFNLKNEFAKAYIPFAPLIAVIFIKMWTMDVSEGACVVYKNTYAKPEDNGKDKQQGGREDDDDKEISQTLFKIGEKIRMLFEFLKTNDQFLYWMNLDQKTSATKKPLAKEILQVILLAISQIQVAQAKNIIIRARLRAFHQVHAVADLENAYGVLGSMEKLLSEINEHIAEEQKAFDENFPEREKAVWSRFEFLESEYLLDTDENDATPAKHADKAKLPYDSKGASPSNNPHLSVTQESILNYIYADTDSWIDSFIQCSSILQYAIYFDHQKRPFDKEFGKKVEKKIQAAVKVRKVKLQENCEAEIKLLKSTYASSSSSSDDSGMVKGKVDKNLVVLDAKRILEEEELRNRSDKEIATLENGSEFFGRLCCASFEGMNTGNVGRNILAKLALDSFKFYMARNHEWHFVQQVFFEVYKQKSTTKPAPFNPNSQVIKMKRGMIEKEVQDRLRKYPTEERTNELLDLVVGNEAFQRYDNAKGLIRKYEKCEQIGTDFETAAMQHCNLRIQEYLDSIQSLQKLVLEKMQALRKFYADNIEEEAEEDEQVDTMIEELGVGVTAKNIKELVVAQKREEASKKARAHASRKTVMDRTEGKKFLDNPIACYTLSNLLEFSQIFCSSDVLQCCPLEECFHILITTMGYIKEHWETSYMLYLRGARVLATRIKEEQNHYLKNHSIAKEFPIGYMHLADTTLTLLLHALDNYDTELAMRNEGLVETMGSTKSSNVAVPAEVTAAKKVIADYFKQHRELREEMNALKKKREEEMQGLLKQHRDEKHMYLLEERNFDKINKIFSYEKKRYNNPQAFFNSFKEKPKAPTATASSAKAGAKAKAPPPARRASTEKLEDNDKEKGIPNFCKEKDEKVQRMAMSLISYRNIEALQNVIREMYCEGVESNKKKALLEHQVRMFLVNMDKKTFAPDLATKNKCSKKQDDLKDLETAYDNQNDKQAVVEKSLLSDAALEQELEKLVEKKKQALWVNIRKELEALEQSKVGSGPPSPSKGGGSPTAGTTVTGKDVRSAREIIRKFKSEKGATYRKELSMVSYRFSLKTFLFLRELYVLVSIGGPFWYHVGTDMIITRAQNSLEAVIQKLFSLNLDAKNSASVDDEDSDEEDAKDVEIDAFDFQPGQIDIAEQAGGGGRAAFLAKHLNNAIKLQDCLNQGYQGKS